MRILKTIDKVQTLILKCLPKGKVRNSYYSASRNYMLQRVRKHSLGLIAGCGHKKSFILPTRYGYPKTCKCGHPLEYGPGFVFSLFGEVLFAIPLTNKPDVFAGKCTEFVYLCQGESVYLAYEDAVESGRMLGDPIPDAALVLKKALQAFENSKAFVPNNVTVAGQPVIH